MIKISVMFFSIVIALSFSDIVFADNDDTPPDANVSDQMIPAGEEPAPPAVTVPESAPEPAPYVEPAPVPAPEPPAEAAPPEQPEAEPAPESR